MSLSLLLQLRELGVDVVRKPFLKWGQPGVSKVESDPVPPHTQWLVYAGGVATEDNTGAEYMMEIVLPVLTWRVPVARVPAWTYGTPVLALPREITLYDGERLTARANGLDPTAKMGLVFLYYEFTADIF